MIYAFSYIDTKLGTDGNAIFRTITAKPSSTDELPRFFHTEKNQICFMRNATVRQARTYANESLLSAPQLSSMIDPMKCDKIVSVKTLVLTSHNFDIQRYKKIPILFARTK